MFKKKCANCGSELQLDWKKTESSVICQSCGKELSLTATSRAVYFFVVFFFFLWIPILYKYGWGFVIGISIPCVCFLVWCIQPLVTNYEVKGK